MVELKRLSKSQGLIRIEHIGIYLHIHNLGLDFTLEAHAIFEGMIGQQSVRKTADHTILLASQSSIGKTNIAMGLTKSLGQKTSFATIFDSQLFP
ncbi:putative RuvB-like protein 1 [Cocos nucifera]|nr:putative RuvB-like protein 1 [Cocos nucifera]